MRHHRYVWVLNLQFLVVIEMNGVFVDDVSCLVQSGSSAVDEGQRYRKDITVLILNTD